MSAPDVTKIGVHGQTLQRNTEMTEREFDAFLVGLRTVLDEIGGK